MKRDNIYLAIAGLMILSACSGENNTTITAGSGGTNYAIVDPVAHRIIYSLSSYTTSSSQIVLRKMVIDGATVYLGWKEITQDQWSGVSATRPWNLVAPRFKASVESGSTPAYGISHVAALHWTADLSALVGKTLTLPTSAQWTAASNLDIIAFGTGPDYRAAASIALTQESRAAAGAISTENRLAGASGVYDLWGNVREWLVDGRNAGPSWNDALKPFITLPTSDSLSPDTAHPLLGLRILWQP